MSADVRFRGTFRYDDEDALAEAVADAGAFIEDDEELQDLLDEEGCIDVGKNRVTIDINLGVPWDWVQVLQDMIEAFAEHASSGEVSCRIDDEEMDPYEAES